MNLDAASSVMLIPGGIGETRDSRERAASIIEKINAAHAAGGKGPVFLGANCMGVISKPGGYDTWFIPEQKLPKQRENSYHRAALISQSGAFMLHRSHQCPHMNPAYMISMGNQTDLTLGDMVHYFKSSENVDVIAVYAEGFNYMDGLEFCKAVRQAVLAGKEVVFYKAGRTLEGRAATSSHTASLAGDYMVCETCVQKAGAIVARTFSEFQDLYFKSEIPDNYKIKTDPANTNLPDLIMPEDSDTAPSQEKRLGKEDMEKFVESICGQIAQKLDLEKV
jgi:acyl-CoA synthetase (NDP forming)